MKINSEEIKDTKPKSETKKNTKKEDVKKTEPKVETSGIKVIKDVEFMEAYPSYDEVYLTDKGGVFVSQTSETTKKITRK